MHTMLNKTCSSCGSAFQCCAEQGGKACWCHAYPAIMPIDTASGCRCPSCLARAIAEHIDTTIKASSHRQALALAGRFANPGVLIEHIDYTLENGNYVFSSWYHLKRGSCCGNGCRHCPYPAK